MMSSVVPPFTTSADVYDVIYQHLPYDEQVALLSRHVKRLAPHADSLLEVGCGTGQYLVRLMGTFSVEGVDISQQMLDVAAARIGDVPLHAGDMRTFDLGRTFDVVACLFSSIGYMATEPDLRLAVANMARHLDADGVLIVDPWFTPEDAIDGFAGGIVEQQDDLVVSRVSYSRIQGRTTITDMHHVVARRNVGIAHYVERHEMGLFSDREYAELFAELGFHAERVDDVAWMGRSRWVAQRR